MIKHKAESYYEFTDIKISFVFIILAWGKRNPENILNVNSILIVSDLAAPVSSKKVVPGVKVILINYFTSI